MQAIDTQKRLDEQAGERARDAVAKFYADFDAALNALNRRLTDGDPRWCGICRISDLGPEFSALADKILPLAVQLRLNVVRARFVDAVAAAEKPAPRKRWKVWGRK